MRHRSLVLVVLLCVACRTPATHPATPAAPAAGGWRSLADEYLAAAFEADPMAAARLGRHEYDGRIRSYTAQAYQQDAARLRAFRDRVLRLDRASLSADDDYERALLMADVSEQLFWIEKARAPQRNCVYTAEPLMPGLFAIRPYAAPDVRARALARYARALPRALTELRGLLEQPLPRAHAETCAELFEGLAAFLETDAPAAFAEVKDPAARAELSSALRPAVQAAREHARWFRDLLPVATGPFALGRALYEDMIRSTEGLAVDAEEVERLGLRDVEANTAALREACARFAPGQGLDACLSRMMARKPSQGTLAAARVQLPELLEFLRSRALVTLPTSEQPRVEETPSYARSNQAAIEMPGPYEEGLPAFYYITPPDPSWPRAEQEAYLPSSAVLLNTSVHEVWPGHYLQDQVARRARWPLARVILSYAFVEGWAHYTEQMMWDAGFRNDQPEFRIAQLQEALLRDVRLLSAVGLHVKGMTVEESERLFRERAFQDPANAHQQALRGTYDPAYHNYTLGKLQILRLREEWAAPRGGRAAWGRFHDALLELGAPRLGLARAKLLGEPLP
jgi:uncharacterized protein (DUF885 family)